MPHTLQFGTTTIEYEVVYKARKTLAIHVHPDTRVTVDAPAGTEQAAIEERIRKRAPWILQQQRDFGRHSLRSTPRHYVSGASHTYLGRQYRLKVQQSATDREMVKMQRGYIVIHVRDPKDTEHVKQLLENWYRKRAHVVFEERLRFWHPRLARYDVPYPELVVRKMKSRWGSCTGEGKVTLNLALIQAPKDCIDYVMVHELCHLKEHNHSPAFYRMLNALLPDWEARKQRLESFGALPG